MRYKPVSFLPRPPAPVDDPGSGTGPTSVQSLYRYPLEMISPNRSVFDAACQMASAGVGALAVVEDDSLVGIISERDLMIRVMAQNRNAHSISVSEAMSFPVRTVSASAELKKVLQIMLAEHIRHLPVMDQHCRPIGMLSIRDVMTQEFERLDQENESLMLFLTADGPGG